MQAKSKIIVVGVLLVAAFLAVLLATFLLDGTNILRGEKSSEQGLTPRILQEEDFEDICSQVFEESNFSGRFQACLNETTYMKCYKGRVEQDSCPDEFVCGCEDGVLVEGKNNLCQYDEWFEDEDNDELNYTEEEEEEEWYMNISYGNNFTNSRFKQDVGCHPLILVDLVGY